MPAPPMRSGGCVALTPPPLASIRCHLEAPNGGPRSVTSLGLQKEAHMNVRSAHRWAAVVGAALLAFTTHATAIQLQAVGLVSDDLALHPAKLLDPGLQNAWGLSH